MLQIQYKVWKRNIMKAVYKLLIFAILSLTLVVISVITNLNNNNRYNQDIIIIYISNYTNN